MKKITSFLLLVAVFATMFSMTAFAAGANTFTITTDVTSVTADGTVVVTIEAEGDWADVAQVTAAIKFDSEKFSVTTSGRAPWCFDSTWYNSTKDGNTANLGYITTPSVGENPTGQLNIVYLSMDGYTIDDGGDLYAGGKTTVAKVNFTALVDVETIDASCFSLVEDVCAVESDALHTLTFNQIEAAEEEPTPVELDEVTGTAVTYDKGNGFVDTFAGAYKYVASFDASNMTSAGFYWFNGTTRSAKTDEVDASAITAANGGTFEYGIIMYGIPSDVTITAIPYYVPAN